MFVCLSIVFVLLPICIWGPSERCQELKGLQVDAKGNIKGAGTKQRSFIGSACRPKSQQGPVSFLVGKTQNSGVSFCRTWTMGGGFAC